MLQYVALEVLDLSASKEFYDRLLSVMNYDLLTEEDGWLGYGIVKPTFWLGSRGRTVTPCHIAFQGQEESDVLKFYEKALELGAQSDASPKLRNKFYKNHYCAFVRDLDQHRVGMIFHRD